MPLPKDIVVGGVWMAMGFVFLLPLWAALIGVILLVIVGWLAMLTAEVCHTMIPASEVEQRKIDWIVNRELPDLPDRYTCLDCGRFPEDCVCDEPEGPAKKWAHPCPAAVQAMDDPSNNCIMCGFPVHDH